MPRVILRRQVIFFVIVATGWTIAAIVRPDTFRTVLTAIWWGLAAVSFVLARSSKARH